MSWLKSDGNAYINTGVVPSADMEFGAKFVNDENISYTRSVFGTKYGSESSTVQLLSVAQTNAVYRLGGLSRTFTNFFTTGSLFDVKMNKTGININGTNYNWSGSIGGFTTTDTMKLAGVNNTSGRNFVGKIYGAYIKDNGVYVLNMVPVKRNSDNAYGMYDTVSGTFFGNAGSGSFTGE